MKLARIVAAAVLLAVALLCFFPGVITADSTDEQFRNDIDLPPGSRFPLGTDDLGRNRLARLLEGTRTSLTLAPVAAALSVALACGIGLLAAGGRIANRLFESGADLAGSLPWLFLLIALRAALPLDASPGLTTGLTYALLAALGWAGPARVLRNAAAQLRESDFALQALSLGVSRWRITFRHILPNVWPVALAQFWVSIPVFILAEANLGLLGMGVPEPYASLGNQLRELQSYSAVSQKPWLLAPALLLTLIVGSMWVLGSRKELS